MYENYGDIYDRAAEVAERALIANDGSGFGLEDIAPEQVLVSTLRSFAGPSLVASLFDGCMAALAHSTDLPARVRRLSTEAIPTHEVTVHDTELAKHWLERSVIESQDSDARIEMVNQDVIEHGLVGDPVRLSSLMVSLVKLSSELAS